MTDLHIYTEGDQQRGLGHLTRCSAYASAWSLQYGSVHWVVDGDDAARRLLHGARVEWHTWQNTPVTERWDAVAIVDSYSATLPVLQSIAASYRRVVYLDDTFRLPYPAGLVVHAAPGEPRAVAGEAEWLWGPAWQPLRPAFWNVPKRTHVAERVNRILVLMGGTDPHNLTPRMVELARAVCPDAEIHAVIGTQSLSDIAGCITHRGLNDGQMAKLMCESDVAISAAGQTTYELAACGLPSVLVCLIDNQAGNLKGWAENDAFPDGIWWNAESYETYIINFLKKMSSREYRTSRSIAAQKLVTGEGVCRLIELLLYSSNHHES